MLAAERGQHGKRQRQQRGDRRADARAALRGVRHFELGGKRRAVAGDAEDAVGAVPGGSFANGAGGRRHAADGLRRAVFGGFEEQTAPEADGQLHGDDRAERDAAAQQRKDRVRRADQHHKEQQAVEVEFQTDGREKAFCEDIEAQDGL